MFPVSIVSYNNYGFLSVFIHSIESVLNSIEDWQFDYENLYNLEDNKIGLINKALFANSKIKQSEKLNCTHYFHINCIDTWLSENTRCPLCRYDLRKTI